ncbi:hypothetical protein GCM10027515_05630 [Schumannella luteola]|uniref:DUF4097 domain-containing protein n=1 Tax=Schumannella luteola TaxID=472059 RepID=A0A852YAJ6_9MICO|nr:DUF4097 family beta strand repeat-containing protein [Schumannella luteola]NYG98304.1 hypothetical protein [Schumannella luteola]TPX05737.1 DUF4097 domain-containing protein [Schumannella luteola]
MAQEKWLVDGPKTIDIERVRSLKVGLIGGQVDVVAHDEPGARVEVHSVDGRPLKITIDGDRLEIDHPQLGWDNFLDVFRSFHERDRADVSVAVPRDIALKLGVVNATALVSGVRSDASLSTVNGDLVVDGVEGDTTINSVNGEVSVRDHRGRVDAKTVNGDVTVSGELARFTADSVGADVYVDAAGIPDQLRVNTVSGSVAARLDAGVPAQYTINTVSGRIQLDDAEITGVRGRYQGRFGELERHWVDVKVNTVSGAIDVLHRADDAPAPASEPDAAAPSTSADAASATTDSADAGDTTSSVDPTAGSPA